ncbi:hypothetical protein [Cohnella boryungensis]|uniref:Uncharacterized protein n=1 Tax=Cohnella boryungensis TaxID=768479 RepID=A0ABV8SEY6_9BACL
MHGIMDSRPPAAAAVITLKIHMVDGSTFVQELPVDDADGVQEFLDWFRQPGRNKVWTWQVPSSVSLHALHHPHIMAVDVDGYVEPDGRTSRWYERLLDRISLWWRFRG